MNYRDAKFQFVERIAYQKTKYLPLTGGTPKQEAEKVTYQSGEKLFSEYDQEQKYYPYKNEVTHKEIMLPPHVPPEFADRNTLWNSAEAQEKQWNSQLARRFVLAIPREIPPEQYADLLRDYCREFFVSKGMIADFAIHDKGDGNPEPLL